MKVIRRVSVLVAVGFIALGVSYVSAKIIPGINRPYDPPNYYSETSISWADTYNPSFFYRDLARKGMRVLDVTRDAKNALSLKNTIDQLANLVTYVNNKIVDMTGSSTDKSINALAVYQNISNNTEGIYNGSNIPLNENQTLFRTTVTSEDPRKSFSREDQFIWIDNAYSNILQAAKNNLDDSQLRGDAISKVLINSVDTQGSLSVNQSNTQAVVLYNAEIDRRNALLSNYLALEAARDMAEKDKELKAAEDMKNGMKFRMSDPYNTAETDAKNYERPTGLGFVKFK